ncbi:alcohol dehydrogenase catalytic domain-containing protein [Arthrobacter sp. P2b]|uniref:alcohol dehydrogenase catalytic domain-containing protein n=1 Tax=Arthrobacter sp. P2b TaxID=1938741 RepID=UPI0020CA74A3|nr:alcohol dehydrogenase catalytic domain-containing protein [Arthrobacter sp. P2b]
MGLPYALRLVYGMRAPKNPVPGLDLAGTVTAVGAAVTRFSVGDEVWFRERSLCRVRRRARKQARP